MKGIIGILIAAGLAALGSYITFEFNNSGYLLATPFTLLTIWLICCHLMSVFNHLDNLANLHSTGVEIEAAEAKLEAVKSLAADQTGLPEQLLALDQQENPVTTYMSFVRDALRDVESCKRSQARLLGQIASRAAGPFSVVVKVFGRTAT